MPKRSQPDESEVPVRPYRSGPSKTWLKIKNPKAPGVLRFEDRTTAGDHLPSVSSITRMGTGEGGWMVTSVNSFG